MWPSRSFLHWKSYLMAPTQYGPNTYGSYSSRILHAGSLLSDRCIIQNSIAGEGVCQLRVQTFSKSSLSGSSSTHFPLSLFLSRFCPRFLELDGEGRCLHVNMCLDSQVSGFLNGALCLRVWQFAWLLAYSTMKYVGFCVASCLHLCLHL